MRSILAVWAAMSAALAVILPHWWKLTGMAPWVLLALAVILGKLLAYQPRHAVIGMITVPPAQDHSAEYGSMWYDAELDWRARAGLLPSPASAVSGPGGNIPKTELINGHVPGCLCPGGIHHWTACPEDEDWPDDDETPGTLPDMLPAGPLVAGPSLVDTALASAEEAPEDAGWTDQLLADLHDAPTVLDSLPAAPQAAFNVLPPPWAAEWAAQLRAQDDDAAEFISRLAYQAAAYRHGL